MTRFFETAYELEQQYEHLDIEQEWFSVEIRRSLVPQRVGSMAMLRELDFPPGPGTLQRYLVQRHRNAKGEQHEHILYFRDGDEATLRSIWRTLMVNPKATVTEVDGWELLVADRSVGLSKDGNLTIF